MTELLKKVEVEEVGVENSNPFASKVEDEIKANPFIAEKVEEVEIVETIEIHKPITPKEPPIAKLLKKYKNVSDIPVR